MAGDLYEQLVEDYLTIFEHLAVIPQFPVLFGKAGEPCFHESEAGLSWAAFPDLLAVDFANKQVQIIEVNRSAYAANLKSLAKRVAANRQKIEEYVRWFTKDGWGIQWRFFVRRKMSDQLKAAFEDGDFQPRMTHLEDVFDQIRDQMP
ncbi:MAG: hypothetical protein ACRD2G_05790 [Terriglobia bacterium]